MRHWRLGEILVEKSQPRFSNSYTSDRLYEVFLPERYLIDLDDWTKDDILTAQSLFEQDIDPDNPKELATALALAFKPTGINGYWAPPGHKINYRYKNPDYVQFRNWQGPRDELQKPKERWLRTEATKIESFWGSSQTEKSYSWVKWERYGQIQAMLDRYLRLYSKLPVIWSPHVNFKPGQLHLEVDWADQRASYAAGVIHKFARACIKDCRVPSFVRPSEIDWEFEVFYEAIDKWLERTAEVM